MKITIDYFIQFLIKTYQYRYAHEDYQTLHQKQLKIILTHLKIPGKISFNDKKFSFIMLDTKSFNHDQLNKLSVSDKENLMSYISSHVNHMLEEITREKSIRSSGQLTTFKALELFHSSINSRRNDYALSYLNDSTNKVYYDSIKETLLLLYKHNVNHMSGWSLNSIVSDPNELNILNQTICDFDYF